MVRNSENLTSDPYIYIPDDALFFVETQNLPGFMNLLTDNNRIFTELESVKEFDSQSVRIKYLRDILNRNEISYFFDNNRAVLSFHLTADGKLIPLLSAAIPPSARYNSISRALETATGVKVIQAKINGIRLSGLAYGTKEKPDTMFFVIESGLLLSSSSSAFLTHTIKENKSGADIRSMPGITRLMSAAGRNEDKVFLIFRNFAKLLRKAENVNSHLISDSFLRMASGAEGDIFFKENGLVLSGYTETSDTADIIYRFKSTQSGELNSSDVIPSSVILFETLLLQPMQARRPSALVAPDSSQGFASAFSRYLGDEITRALIDLKEDSGAISQVLFYELNNRNMAEQMIIQALTERKEKPNLSDNEILKYFQPDDQIRIPVYRSPFKNLASFVSPGFADSEDDSLIAFIDNFMVAGSSFSAINRVLYDNILKKTLANDLIYREFESTLPSRAGYYFYCKPGEITGLLNRWLNEEVTSKLNENTEHLKKITAVGFQLAASNDMVYNSLSVKFGEQVREESGAEWETLLDTVACIKPFFFTNHNTGAKEIFIQDYKNSVYLINSAGRVLWKLLLNERISGPVYMIDYYGNGKNQLLFAGRNFLHLIDRNGNYVERYPVRLRSPASGPLSIFDYDNNNEYRLLIPGDDRLIYAYDKSGNVVRGWKPFLTNGIVKDGLKFFRISGKDYIIAADNANVYFLDRTGNVRLKVKEQVTKATGSEIRLNTGRESGIVFSSPDGTVKLVTFDGNVKKFDFRPLSVDHMFDFFDVDGDGFGEYVFIDRGKLYLYDHDRSPVFEKDFNTDSLEGPIFFTFSSADRKIGVFDKNKKLIYLLDNTGNIMAGFPRRGASVFSIGKLSETGDFQLIVGGDDNFLYNYKLIKEDNK